MNQLSHARIFLSTRPISMNCTIDHLMRQAQEIFDQDPLSGHLFLFFNGDRDQIKILFWDRDGFCIWHKRLEAGTFQLPTTTNHEQGVELNEVQLNRLLGGVDLESGRRRRRYHRVAQNLF